MAFSTEMFTLHDGCVFSMHDRSAFEWISFSGKNMPADLRAGKPKTSLFGVDLGITRIVDILSIKKCLGSADKLNANK
jgi:hypothetical protein